MKYFFYRLEIQDGEHGYFSDGVVPAKNESSARKKAEWQAKNWYEGEEVEIEKNEGKQLIFEFIYQCVSVWVDDVREISKEHYDILKQYL